MMVEINYMDQEDSSSDLPAIELKAAQETIYAFLMAIRNFGLFPPEHVSTRNMLAGLCRTINLFTKEYGELRLEIEKDRILYHDAKVYEEPNHDENPAFIFFRDGVRILEFLEGLEEHEIIGFFKIIAHYKIITEEPEGDLVTDLWSGDLPHINYEASDELWEAEPVLEFSLLNPNAQEHMSRRGGLIARGFDMLKSMLGIDAGPKKKDKEADAQGGIAEVAAEGATATGAEETGRPGEFPDEEAGFAGEGEGGGFAEGGDGEGGEGGGYYVPEPKPTEELDFWAALQKTLDGEVEQPEEAGKGGGSGSGAGGAKGRPGHRSSGPGKKPGRGGPKGGKGEDVTSGGHRTADAAARLNRGRENKSPPPAETDYIGVSLASVEVGHSLWNFTQEEQRTLDQMVKDYEENDDHTDAVEFVMIIIQDEEEPHIFESMIDFMREELRITLSEQKFRIAYVMLTNLRDFREKFKESRSWTTPILDEFFEDIGEAEILEVMLPFWPQLPKFGENKLKALAAVLQMLPARAGESLALMFSQVESAQGRRILADLIASFVSRDKQILEKLLERPEEELVLRLIKVLDGLSDEAVAERLLYKVILHPKDLVRETALDILIGRESEYFEKLFKLINDQNKGISDKVFVYLGGFRSKVLERLFGDYMATDRFQRQERDHIESCYETLGRCGSDNSVQMLESILFGQPWNFMAGLGTTVHRQGAASALALIKTTASLTALGKAEKSGAPHIRKAWQKATGN